MISHNGVGVRELVLVDGVRPADVVRVHREALHVLRSSIDAAHMGFVHPKGQRFSTSFDSSC